jgi:heme-degrading monooxygenase HmoA
MSEIANTPKPPYYAVIFTSHKTHGDNGYEMMASKMIELASKQSGFLGVESARTSVGITVSYSRYTFVYEYRVENSASSFVNDARRVVR